MVTNAAFDLNKQADLMSLAGLGGPGEERKLEKQGNQLRLVNENFRHHLDHLRSDAEDKDFQHQLSQEHARAAVDIEAELDALLRQIAGIQGIVDEQLEKLRQLPEMEFTADNWSQPPPPEEASKLVALLLKAGGGRLLQMSERFRLHEMTSESMRVLADRLPHATKRLIDAVDRINRACDDLAEWGEDMIDNAKVIEAHGDALRAGWVSHEDARKAAGLR
jgi:hypothetical protein